MPPKPGVLVKAVLTFPLRDSQTHLKEEFPFQQYICIVNNCAYITDSLVTCSGLRQRLSANCVFNSDFWGFFVRRRRIKEALWK